MSRIVWIAFKVTFPWPRCDICENKPVHFQCLMAVVLVLLTNQLSPEDYSSAKSSDRM